MATRFYFPSTGATSVTPAFGAGWNITTNAARRQMVKTRINSAQAFSAGVGDTVIGNQQLIRQFVYEAEALSAQTFSGTVKGQFRMSGTNPSVGYLAVRVCACSADGSSVTEILAITSSSTGGPVSPPGNANTSTNRRLEEGTDDFDLNLGSVSISAGWLLMVEVGYTQKVNNVARNAELVTGDNSGTDLAEDETTTAADNPWIEFTMDIAFGGAAAGSTRAKRMPMFGVG